MRHSLLDGPKTTEADDGRLSIAMPHRAHRGQHCRTWVDTIHRSHRSHLEVPTATLEDPTPPTGNQARIRPRSSTVVLLRTSDWRRCRHTTLQRSPVQMVNKARRSRKDGRQTETNSMDPRSYLANRMRRFTSPTRMSCRSFPLHSMLKSKTRFSPRSTIDCLSAHSTLSPSTSFRFQ